MKAITSLGSDFKFWSPHQSPSVSISGSDVLLFLRQVVKDIILRQVEKGKINLIVIHVAWVRSTHERSRLSHSSLALI